MSQVHDFRCQVDWRGSTADGYADYARAHRVSVPPAETELGLSADPAFGGDPARLNPEQLLLVAASSCQLLSFLAIVARARIDVVAYSDDAEAAMPEDGKPVRITRITLRPNIVVAGEVDEQRVLRYVQLAHEQCFIANSISSEIAIEPRIKFRDRTIDS